MRVLHIFSGMQHTCLLSTVRHNHTTEFTVDLEFGYFPFQRLPSALPGSGCSADAHSPWSQTISPALGFQYSPSINLRLNPSLGPLLYISLQNSQSHTARWCSPRFLPWMSVFHNHPASLRHTGSNHWFVDELKNSKNELESMFFIAT